MHELKSVFANRAVLEVRTPSPMEAQRALEGVAIVEKTSLFGTALHVWLRPGERDAGAIARRLTESGLRADSVEFVQPSLEDVFMEMVERGGGASA